MTTRRTRRTSGGDDLLWAVVEAAPTGILLVDERGQIVMTNQQFERTLGYTRAELIGKGLDALLPERVRSLHEHHLGGFRADPHPRRLGAGRDLCALHKDGREIPVEIGLAPVTHGGRSYVLASVIDITARKRAEEQIRWLSLAMEQGPASVVMTDLNGNIEYVNPTFSEVTGYAPAEVVGKNPRVLQSGLTPPEVYRAMWTAITGGRSWRGELLNRRKDGSLNWDAMSVYPIRDSSGSVAHFLALKEDITERKQAEEALRGNERRLRTLFETVNLIVLALDANGRVEYVNPFFLSVTGYRAVEVVGKDWLQFLPQAHRQTMHGVFLELLEQGSHAHHENPIVTKTGQERNIAWNNTVVRDAAGRPTGSLSIGEDITERSQLEAQLRQAQKMEAIGRLAGGVAHDFNNVLTAVFGYVDLLREEFPSHSSTHQDLTEIRKAAERASGLTRQLLAFSRQQVLEPVVMNLNELVEDFDKMLRRVIGEDVALRLVLPSDLGNVRADPGQLQQVIMNLAVNARDAMPGGGSLLIETGNVDLTEQYAEVHQPVVPGRYVMLAVSDTGSGMTPETKARIFEPFFTTKERGKGTGLGLSTVYGIVKQSGGYVWVYSELGRGSTFKIYLPRVDAATEPATPQREGGTLAGNETILLAEDDETLRPLAKGVLARFGYTVLDASSPVQALALARQYQGPIHLLVADVVMPGASGRELAKRLAASRPDTKVLFISGYTGDAIVHHGMLEPGLHFLQKPFTPEAFARKVREVLDRS